MRGETKSRVAMSLLPSPSLTSRTTSRSVGVSDAQPLAGSFAFAAAALRVGDRLLGGQGGALGPRGVKVLLAHGVSQRRHRGFVAGVIDLEPDRAHALPDAVCRAEEPGRFAVTAGLAGQSGEAFEDVGDAQVRLDVGGTRQRVMGVALGLLRLTLLRSPRGRASSAPPSRPAASPSRPPRRPSAGPRSDPRPPARPAAMRVRSMRRYPSRSTHAARPPRSRPAPSQHRRRPGPR